jgi:[acyl-carrier-protein] S-malonyltransferase
VKTAKPEFKARMTLQQVLETVEIKKPRIPVISNVDAAPHSDPETSKMLLATQVTL